MWYSDLGFARYSGVQVFRLQEVGYSGVRVFGLEPRRVGEALGAFEAEIPIPPPLLWGGAWGMVCLAARVPRNTGRPR